MERTHNENTREQEKKDDQKCKATRGRETNGKL